MSWSATRWLTLLAFQFSAFIKGEKVILIARSGVEATEYSTCVDGATAPEIDSADGNEVQPAGTDCLAPRENGSIFIVNVSERIFKPCIVRRNAFCFH